MFFDETSDRAARQDCEFQAQRGLNPIEQVGQFSLRRDCAHNEAAPASRSVLGRQRTIELARATRLGEVRHRALQTARRGLTQRPDRIEPYQRVEMPIGVLSNPGERDHLRLEASVGVAVALRVAPFETYEARLECLERLRMPDRTSRIQLDGKQPALGFELDNLAVLSFRLGSLIGD